MTPPLFEDVDILAVNKPEGLASIPERDPTQEVLLSQLSATRATKLYLVHRLDKEVSGVILFAKNAAAHKFLNEQFSRHTVRKTYRAVVLGVVAQESGTIDAPLRQFGSGRMGVDSKRGKESVTSFHVLTRFAAHTLIEVRPVTGRRHQIRVHLHSRGHAIVGDPLYGEKAMQHRFLRLMLHVQKIEFRLPSGDDVVIEAPVPDSFTQGLKMVQVPSTRGALKPTLFGTDD
ncbi:MAG: RluA family pseudouridine synthase [Deltaproteobacteria bacterium]|nr:RluA family pseudouridine synthase [Deltaproteobacteria bacterium]